MAVAGWFVGRQRPSVILLLVVVTNLVNLVLDVVFIIGFGMRAEGAALAALIADYTALAVAVAMLWREWQRHHGNRRFDVRRAGLGNLPAYRELWRINGDLFVRTLCLQVCFVLFLVASAGQGTAILAANNVLLQLLVVTALVLDSPAHALEALAGWSVGSRNRSYLRAWCATGCGGAPASPCCSASPYSCSQDHCRCCSPICRRWSRQPESTTSGWHGCH